MEKVTYKIYGNADIRQTQTTIDITNISPIEYFNHIEETIRDRFKNYSVRINHAGKTITVNKIEQ
jgi:hypothetical protein